MLFLSQNSNLRYPRSSHFSKAAARRYAHPLSHHLHTSLPPCLFQPPVTHHQSPNVVSFHPVNILLNEVESRVLGSLIEKEITTPEYYPLSLNALVNACNQKSNRDPVMNLDEGAVREALRTLDKKGLAGAADNMVSRVS